ncbi:MAG: hypothetical protein ACRDY0_06425, partial [Acidimicrobiales bacterium]
PPAAPYRSRPARPDPPAGPRCAGAPAVELGAHGDVVVVGPGQRGWFHEEVGGRIWRVSARSFFQAGPAGAEAVVSAVDRATAGAVGPGGLLVDAYAGVGVIGGVVAGRRRCRLIAVEASAEAVADARVNLADLDATVVRGPVARWSPPPGARPDVVVADPARPGLGRPGVAALASAGAPRLVLVSCDPASLGRDVVLLAGAGYLLVTVEVVDIFPGTPHVETVSTFRRRAGGLADRRRPTVG